MGFKESINRTVSISMGIGSVFLAMIIVLMLSGTAVATDQLLTAVGTDTALTGAAGNTIVERGSPADTDTAEIAMSGGAVVMGNATNKAVDFDTNSGTIFLYDEADAGANDVTDSDRLTFNGDISIVAGKTLTFILGDDEDSGLGTVSMGLHISDGANTDIFIAGADATTRGGNVTFDAYDNSADNIGITDLDIDADMKITTLTLKSGDGGGNGIGSAWTAVIGDGTADTIDVTGVVITGGAGLAAVAGGAMTVTGTGTWVVGAGGATVTAGGGGSTAIGGALKWTVDTAVTSWSGDTALTGGAAGSTTAAGQTAEIEFSNGFSGTGAWVVTGGIGASGAGTADGGIGLLDADGAFTTTKTVTFQGGAAGVGTTDAAAGGAAQGTFALATDVLGWVVTGGNGGANAASNGGAATFTATGAATVGASGVVVTGGDAGADTSGTAAGGAASIVYSSTTVTTGDVTITGGNATDHDDSDGGAASVTFTDDVTATAQTLTVVGGNGDADVNGDGGAATAHFIASGTFSSVVLDDGTAGNATAGGANLTFNASAVETFTGTITAQGADEGTIKVENDDTDGTTFVNQIGTSSVSVGTLNVLSAQATYADFSSDVYIKDINLDSTNAISMSDFAGNVTATTLDLTDGGNAAVATAKFAKDLTATVTLTDGGGGDDAVLIFDGTTKQTVTGVISGAAANSGNITVSNVTADMGVTFMNNIADTHQITVDTSGIADFRGTVGAYDVTIGNLGDITLHKALVAANNFTLDNTASTNITIGPGQTYGDASNASTDMITGEDIIFSNTGGSEVVNVYLPSDFTSGHLVLFQDSNGTGVSAAELADVIPVDTFLIDYAAADGGASYSGTTSGESVVITATRKSASAAAAELGVTAEAADATFSASEALTGATSAADIASAAALTAAMRTGGATAIEAAEQVQGSPDGLSAASGAAVASTGGAVVAVGSSRMASLRTGNAYASTQGSGFNAGSVSHSNSMWMKPFASFGLQSERKGIAGYDADTFGLAIGADTRLNAHSVMGLSFSYADTDVDGKGAGRSRTDISSYQITAYGDYTANDWYVEALVGYAYNEIDSKRDITFANATASGETDSNQFMFSVNAGMPIQVESNSYFTPTTGLSFTHVTNKSYTETGAGGLNLAVNAEDITIAKLHVGGRYHATIATSDGKFTPEVRAKLLYDLAGDDGSSTNTFTGGGAAFDVKGLDVVEFATAVGAGISYTPSFDEGMNLSVNYDAEIKENFTGHSANFTLKYAF